MGSGYFRCYKRKSPGLIAISSGKQIAMFIEAILILIGLSLGSFIGLLTYRLPRHQSIVSGRSHCETCDRQLCWYELIPLFSYILLRGRCRSCNASISKRYPAIEIVSAFIVLASFFKCSLSLEFIEACVFLLLMLTIFIIDWEHLVIPNILVFVGIGLGLLVQLIHGTSSITTGLINATAAFLFVFVIRFLGNLFYKKETLGFGDVKFAGLLGLWLGFSNFIITFWLAAILGAIYGIWKTLFQKTEKPMQSLIPGAASSNSGALNIKIPFGSFLAVSAAGLFWYQQTISESLRVWWNFNQ